MDYLKWQELLSGSYSIGKLAPSVEAKNSFCHARAQLLLILIETLDLENLLQMVHDEVPFRLLFFFSFCILFLFVIDILFASIAAYKYFPLFYSCLYFLTRLFIRQGNIVFSLSEIQEIDAVVSSFSNLGMVEAGPLILAWATFLCLLLSLPRSEVYNQLMVHLIWFLFHLKSTKKHFKFEHPLQLWAGDWSYCSCSSSIWSWPIHIFIGNSPHEHFEGLRCKCFAFIASEFMLSLILTVILFLLCYLWWSYYKISLIHLL